VLKAVYPRHNSSTEQATRGPRQCARDWVELANNIVFFIETLHYRRLHTTHSVRLGVKRQNEKPIDSGA